MLDRTQIVVELPAELAGDIHPLMAQLGAPDGITALTAITSGWQMAPITHLAGLSRFLHRYHDEVLLRVELPSILRAYQHVRHHEVRELMELDLRLKTEIPAGQIALASQRVGFSRLRRLRPLHDYRPVQRYLQAVEAGEAHGWHTLVYGLTLAVYSLPLRQGLSNYARQTLSGFVNAAERDLKLDEGDCQTLLDGLCAGLPAAINEQLEVRHPALVAVK